MAKKKVDKPGDKHYIYDMIVRNSESRALAVYLLLMVALALTSPYAIFLLLPISFYVLACVLTERNLHYQTERRLHLFTLIPCAISRRGPPQFILLK